MGKHDFSGMTEEEDFSLNEDESIFAIEDDDDSDSIFRDHPLISNPNFSQGDPNDFELETETPKEEEPDTDSRFRFWENLSQQERQAILVARQRALQSQPRTTSVVRGGDRQVLSQPKPPAQVFSKPLSILSEDWEPFYAESAYWADRWAQTHSPDSS